MIAKVKNKIIGLCLHLKCEVAKTNQNKSRQGVSRIYWQTLAGFIGRLNSCYQSWKKHERQFTSTWSTSRLPIQSPNVMEGEEENDSKTNKTGPTTLIQSHPKGKLNTSWPQKSTSYLTDVRMFWKNHCSLGKRQCHFLMYTAEKLADFKKWTADWMLHIQLTFSSTTQELIQFTSLMLNQTASLLFFFTQRANSQVTELNARHDSENFWW